MFTMMISVYECVVNNTRFVRRFPTCTLLGLSFGVGRSSKLPGVYVSAVPTSYPFELNVIKIKEKTYKTVGWGD